MSLDSSFESEHFISLVITGEPLRWFYAEQSLKFDYVLAISGSNFHN